MLSMNDKNEEEKLGSLLIGNHGEGKIIYTGLSFFRQIPSGVTGAYRLLINLISLEQWKFLIKKNICSLLLSMFVIG